VVEPGREWDRADLTAEDQADQVGDHKGHADRDEHLIEVTTAHAPQQHRLHDQTEHADEQRGEHQRQPELPCPLHDRERYVRAEHVKGAVREIDDIHHPKTSDRPAAR